MRKTYFFLILTASLIIGCAGSTESGNSETSKTSNPDSTQNPDTLKVDSVTSRIDKPKVDKHLNNIARVIAGLAVSEDADSALIALQNKSFYQSYKTFANSSFENVEDKMIEPVTKWLKKEDLIDKRKNSTCFYPFSGPDILFASTFYPRAQQYILLGLEKRGYVPDFGSMTEEQQKAYFTGLKKSMKYINSRGYFVTQHMGSDFSRNHLNGVTHMMLYMLARRDYKIVFVGDGWLDAEGNVTKIAEEDPSPKDRIRLKIIEFFKEGDANIKTVYFFNHNIQDKNGKDHAPLVKFVNSFPNRGAYLKAAQCASFNPNFETARQLVLNCDRVIQDDSGIPYKYLADTAQYETKLYGTYTRVIDDLKWCFQPQLKKDLETKGDTRDLPFKISYNGNYGKGVLIYSKKK